MLVTVVVDVIVEGAWVVVRVERMVEVEAGSVIVVITVFVAVVVAAGGVIVTVTVPADWVRMTVDAD